MSHDKIEVRWEVADGYSGRTRTRTRPQTTTISHSDILSCDSEEDVKGLIEESIEADFEQRISPDYGEDTYAKALEIWREAQAEK
jgi:hypothetical protein